MADNFGLSLEAMGVSVPFSQEAEQAVLGAIITDSSTLDEVMDLLSADSFYLKHNREIYNEIVLLYTAGKPIDFVTALEVVRDAGVFESEEDAKNYLFAITQTVPTLSNVKAYAEIVRDKYLARSLITASREIIDSASDGQENATALLDFAEQKIYDIRNGKQTTGLDTIESVIIKTLDHLYKLSGPDKYKYLGLNTGFKHLDSTLTGLNRSDLIILAARPGVGKTSFALNIMTNVAKKYDCSIAMFSLEMSTLQLAQRLMSSESGISSYSFRTGEFQPNDWTNIVNASDTLSKTKIYLDDTPGISVPEIKARSRRLKNLGLVVVDYLQLMGGNSKRGESRNQEISDITRAFKIMAKELNVPVIVLSQLSRSSEKQQQRRPMLSDLRDSGSIEQDADIVLFLHRENASEEESAAESSEVLLMIAKNRHGETNNFKLHWDGRLTKFTSMEYMRDE